jgi:hypothetical protein
LVNIIILTGTNNNNFGLFVVIVASIAIAIAVAHRLQFWYCTQTKDEQVQFIICGRSQTERESACLFIMTIQFILGTIYA